MTRQTFIEIKLDDLQHNLSVAKACLSPKATLVAVIKANAYGHGMLEVAKCLKGGMLAVATMDEALTLRQNEIQDSLLVLESFSAVEDLLQAIENNIEVVVHDYSQVVMIAEAIHDGLIQAKAKLCVWLKINTGMNRLGFSPDQVVDVVRQLLAMKVVSLNVLMTHFATADDLDSHFFHLQNSRFVKCISDVRSSFPKEKFLISAANSAALIQSPLSDFDLCRPGIMLYGASPVKDREAKEFGLRPVMQFCSTVIAVQKIPVGGKVGYSGRWTAQRDSRIAVIAAGYADGYPRHAEDGTPVMISGVEVPLAGTVSMDMLTVDITDHPDIDVGASVELWGRSLSVDKVASHAGTIGYELLTSVTSRVPRRYC